MSTVKALACAAAAICALAASAETRSPEVAGAPFKIVQMAVDGAHGQLTFVVQNTGAGIVTAPGVRGKIFAHGVRKGFFAYTFDVALEPGESATLRAATPSLPIEEQDLLVVVPARAELRSGGGKNLLWTVDEQQYQALGPHNLGAALAGLQPRATPLLGDCCERCLSEASMCGRNYFAASNACSGRCVSSYSCSNERPGTDGGTTCNCSVSCKPSEQCC